MAGGGTNVFFVPYRPNSRSTKSPPKDETEISQQKHAAREYHRKAKLERVAKLSALHDRHARSTSVPAAQSQPDASSRPLLPRHRSFQEDQDYDKSFAIFDAGTGQLDPFNACVPSAVHSYALDILDYGRSIFESNMALCLTHYPVIEDDLPSLTSTTATSAQWRVFSSTKGVIGEETIKNAVLACAMQSPAAFWSIIFAGATHNAYLQRGVDVPSRDRTLRLSYKTNAIRELNREIQALQGVASDELLLAIITMAAHGSGEQLDPPSMEEKLSALEAVQNFQYYGRMHWERAHFKAIAHLVYQKGGLHTVKMPGLANAIGLADIFFAFLDLRPPAFPLLVPSSLIMSTWPIPQAPLAPSLNAMTTGFDEFLDSKEFETLLQIISNARLITIGFAAHMSQHSDAPTLTRIVWARNFMTHDLLSLPLTLPNTSFETSPETLLEEPSSSSTINIFSTAHSLYNLIRLSALTYALLVLFPVPRVSGLHAKISQQLMLALDDCAVLDLWTTHPKLLLWATILGGIVSEEGNLKSWFAEMTRQARTKMTNLAPMESTTRARSRSASRQRSHSRSLSFPETAVKREADAAWTVVRDICSHFLWFDGPECDGAGRTFWNEACENALVRTRSDEPSVPGSFFEGIV